MFYMKEIIVPETHRALMFKDGQFKEFLMPGVYKYFDWKNTIRFSLFDITNSLENGVSEEALNVLKLHPEKLQDHLLTWETGEHELGLVWFIKISF